MTIELKKYNDSDKELWEDINKSSENTSFLSSLPWIEFQKSAGKETDQYLIYADDQAVGNLYIEFSRRKLAKYAYSPYGPVINWNQLSAISYQPSAITNYELLITRIYEELRSWFKKYCNENNVNLFKFDPLIDQKYKSIFEKLGYKKSLSPAQAIDMWEMDISKDYEEILAEQKKETRYYMKRASKLGATVEKATTLEQVKAFGDLMTETTARKGFQNYSTNYFLKQFESLNKLGMTEIYLVKFQNKYIAGALMNFYKDTIYYAHGASTSDYELSKLASPYFLHAEIIKDAKQKGIKKYNFWGVLPKEIKNHPWRGLSDFKMKFNGEMKSYVGPVEIYANPLKYYANRLFDWWTFKKERY